MGFIVSGLEPALFSHLAGAADDVLAAHGAERHIVTGPGFPDRVTLVDLAAGEPVLLLNFEHQPARTPYRSSHAIFVSENAREAARFVDEIPQALRDRPISLRAFDAAGMMRDAALVDGKELGPAIEAMFADTEASYLHAHYAVRGCFAAAIQRASSVNNIQ
jgi:hypothetical protein